MLRLLDSRHTHSTWNERIASLSLLFGNLRKCLYAHFSVLSVCGNISPQQTYTNYNLLHKSDHVVTHSSSLKLYTGSIVNEYEPVSHIQCIFNISCNAHILSSILKRENNAKIKSSKSFIKP